jgi:putative CocE/NonD family hydrolase
MRIVGDVNVTLSVSSNVPDTDFMVKLVDVDPAGHANARMQPGQIYSVSLTGMITATGLLPGHRLRIEVAGTNFPNYERNLNTGGRNFDKTAAEVARNRVVHSSRNASFIDYTVMPR